MPEPETQRELSHCRITLHNRRWSCREGKECKCRWTNAEFTVSPMKSSLCRHSRLPKPNFQSYFSFEPPLFHLHVDFNLWQIRGKIQDYYYLSNETTEKYVFLAAKSKFSIRLFSWTRSFHSCWYYQFIKNEKGWV